MTGVVAVVVPSGAPLLSGSGQATAAREGRGGAGLLGLHGEHGDRHRGAPQATILQGGHDHALHLAGGVQDRSLGAGGHVHTHCWTSTP